MRFCSVDPHCPQAACLRQHRHCVLDNFGTGGLGSDGGDGIDAFAGWGSKRFKGITWRKIQLVQDILLQVKTFGRTISENIVFFDNCLFDLHIPMFGDFPVQSSAVWSVDLDIPLFKNLLDPDFYVV